VDTKGECYSRALQQILTGVYLSELCLIGLFGAREATGPSILMIILLVVTIIYHITFNYLVGPLEKFLPTTVLAESEDAPLLAAEEGTSGENATEEPESLVQKLGRGKVPPFILNPLAEFLEPQIFDSHQHLKPWLHDPTTDEDRPAYTENDLRTAYINPALTSKTPKLWLVRDEMGISKREIAECEKVGLIATDEGATLDAKNRIVWDHENLENVPIFKKPTLY
jgi:calcium permeable stress-gated cation channel